VIYEDSTIIDLRTLEAVPFLRAGVADTYEVWMRWTDNNALIVTVTGQDGPYFLGDVRYRAALP
jgi:hypothetical protein